MQVVIFAGGFGSRFLNMTQTVPKPLIMIHNQPLITYVIDIYASQGHRDFIICTGYLSEVISDYFSKLYLRDNAPYKVYDIPQIGEVNIIIEDTGLASSTAKRLEMVRGYLDNVFMMTYADGVSNVNLDEVLKLHEAGQYTVTLTSIPVKDQFGSLVLEENTVVSFQEKKQEHWINGGFMVCNSSIFECLEPSEMLEVGTLPKLAASGKLGAYKHLGFWKCVDNIQNKLELEDHLEKKGREWLHGI